MAAIQSLADYMEAVARRQKAEPPSCYGYKADLTMNVGFWREERSGVKVLEKPVIIPSGKTNYQGYAIVYAYSSEEGVTSLLNGQMPPMLPATKKEPRDFESKAQIADNFGNKDAAASVKKGTSDFCVAFRVPAELATQVETPGRDLWIVRFDQDMVGPFLQAVKDGDAAMVAKGLEAEVSGATVDEDGISALMIASTNGSVDICQALLDKGADPKYVEPIASKSALMFAAQGGHTPVVELLIGKGADATQVDTEGSTALMWAATAGKAGAAKALAAHGAKDATNKLGLTALAIAEKLGHADVVVALK